MKSNSRWRRGLAVATVVSALGAPAASAAPVEQSIPSTVEGDPGATVDYSKNSATGDYAPATEAPVRGVQSGADNGFDWGDAGIGAAGILALLSIAGGLTLMVTTRRRRGGTEMPAH